MLGNTSLASELRRSAAEQLTALAYQEPALLAVMSAPEHLHRVVAAAAAASVALIASAGGQAGTLEGTGLHTEVPGGSGVQAGVLGGAGLGDGRAGAAARTAPGPKEERSAAGGMPLTAGTAGEVQLALACVNLAYVMSCLSPGARRWLTARDGGAALTWRLLPLLLHPLITVRRSAARLAAALVFLEEACKHPAWIHARHAAPGGTEAVAAAAVADQRGASPSAASGGGANTGGGSGVGAGVVGSGVTSGAAASAGARSALLQLPEPFSTSYLMPCKVARLAMDANGVAAAAPGRGPGLPPSKLQGRLGSCIIHLYWRPLPSAAHSQVQGVDPRQERLIAGQAALHCHSK